jgi:hypothetical protein
MNTIVLGFKEARGTTPLAQADPPNNILAGIDVPGNKQVRMMMDFKQGAPMPQGVVLALLGDFMPKIAAIAAVKPPAEKPAPAPRLKPTK